MKNKIFALLTAVTLALDTSAYAKVGSRNLEPEQKLQTTCFRFPNTSTAQPTTDTDLGTAGVIAATGLTAATSYLLTGTSLASMPYASRVGIYMSDVITTGNALACTSAVVTGLRLPDGNIVSETIPGGINETLKFTTNVYARVDKISASGCTYGAAPDATDLLFAFTSRYAFVGKKIKTKSDVISACLQDRSVTDFWDCAVGQSLINAAVTVSDSTIDLLNASLFDGAAAADEDMICLSVLPSF